MTSIASTAAATASPALILPAHGHKKGAHAASSTDPSASGSTQGATTTQDLFSSLLQSIEQVIGVSLTSSSAAAGSKTLAGIAATAPAAAANATGAAGALGTRLNARA